MFSGKLGAIHKDSKGGGGLEKSLHPLTLGWGSLKPIITQYFPCRYVILEIARSSGLAGIIFHLRLEGKKRISMSCFLLVLQRMNNVKYNFIMLKNEMESYVRIGRRGLKNLGGRGGVIILQKSSLRN